MMVNAEFYKWIDNKGNMHFTDTPPQGEKVEALELKINTYSSVEVTPLVDRLGKKDFKLLKGKSVPIIIVGDKRMNGFTVARFEKLYQQHMFNSRSATESKL